MAKGATGFRTLLAMGAAGIGFLFLSGIQVRAVVERQLIEPSDSVSREAALVIEPLRISRMIEPIYPLSMTSQGVTHGDVDLIFGIDAQGKLDDYLVTSYSRPEFVREVESVLKQWLFVPMKVNGVPIWSRTRLQFNFEASGVVITRTVMDSINMLVGDMIERSQRVQVLSRQSELDKALVVRHTVAPLYPAQLAESKQAGVVVVDFYVDETGRVRLPVIDGDAHPWFGNAATQAVLQWRFDPPMKKGHPTVVKVRQQFVFNP